MRARHQAWIDVYPHVEEARGPAYTGLSNARPETKALSNPPEGFEDLPFPALEYIKNIDDLPFENAPD
jgi:arylsulfatase